MPQPVNGSYGQTELPFPLPEVWKGKVDQGYFCEGGRESLQMKWDVGTNAPPPQMKGNGIDLQMAKVMKSLDEKGDPRIQIFLKNGPTNRAPSHVLHSISVNEPLKSARPAPPGPIPFFFRAHTARFFFCAEAMEAANEQQKNSIKIEKLFHHGKELDMEKTLLEQGVFRTPTLLNFE